MALCLTALVLISVLSVKAELCPKKCDCDMEKGLNRALCVDQNIVGVEVGVPKDVQVYSLSHNSISELDNFCFRDAGYTSLVVLNLSNNLIFWIGLHAFSNLERLQHLDLSNNRLRYLPSDLFWDTPKLNNLDLSSNIFENLKNEPFIMHTALQILNLNNCRMKSLPERLFTRLPNLTFSPPITSIEVRDFRAPYATTSIEDAWAVKRLRKLDLSENYFVTLSTEALAPLRKLQRIELRNEFWKCTKDLISVESWILSRGITYQKQCRNLAPKMSEKMISIAVEKVEVDVNDVWNITKPVTYPPVTEHPSTLTPLQKFDKEFSAVQAFIIGVEIGLAFGIVGTYVWLRKFCHCGQLNCWRPVRRRRDRDMRSGLLWSNVIHPDLETPPSFRRNISLPDGSPPYGVPAIRETNLQVDAIRMPNRTETPPPPYHECRISV